MRTLQRSFAGGEITPELYGRIDLAKFQTGLATCENFIILPHGPAANRPGFQFIKEVKTSAKATRLIPFSYSTTQTYALEFGDLYIRFYTQAGRLLAGTVTAWVTATAYIVGDIRSNGGTNYYCATAHTSGVFATDLAAVKWVALTADIVEVPSPYLEADLFDLHFVQSADVLTIVHPSYAPRELRRLGAVNWALTTISFAPTITPPTGIAVSASPASGSVVNRYVVTSLAADGLDESVVGPEGSATGSAISAITKANPGVLTTAVHGLSVNDLVYVSGIGGMVEITDGYYYVNTVPLTTTLTLKTLNDVAVNTTAYTTYTSGGTVKRCAVAATNDLTVAGNKNTISWTAVTGATRYYVYKQKNGGIYGYCGQTSTTSFADQNITADANTTPSEVQSPFSSSNNYPQAVSYFEQRRVFAGTNNKPQNVWLTRSATESNMNYSIPTQDNDAIVVKVAAREANTIRHLVPLADLVMLTSGGEWKLSSGSADALTPATIQIKPQSYMGASNVQPVVTGNSILYAQDRGSRIREVSYSWEAQSYKTIDASIMIPHLLDGESIVDMAYMRSPYQVLWCVRGDGVMLGLTYVPDQQVMAWHKHETDGLIESVCVIAEGDEDVLYAVVQRTINGSSVRYIERLHSRQFAAIEDAFFVDSGLTYDSTPATTISGLDHLEGETVSALADGAVVEGLVVTSGDITLPAAASVVHIGLPITATLETLPVSMEMPGFGQGRVKNVNSVFIRLYRSSGVKIGPSADRLVEYKQRTNEAYGSPPALKSDEVEVVLSPQWSSSGGVFVQTTSPLPLTVVSLSLDVATER